MEDWTAQTDRAFRHAFERGAIPNHAFRHRDHLRLAWIYLRESDMDAAVTRLCQNIRRYAEGHGAGEKYHETLTQAWARIVALAVVGTPQAAAFGELLTARPHLLNKQLPLRHFSPERLWSARARERWVEPDLRPFPRVPG